MQEIENKKGCVYFFKHVGLSPIKIGFSLDESPLNRFVQFKTYAPYGSELIGFIRDLNPKKLETILHERFATKRLKGEWFDISLEEANSIIKFYSNIEDIEEMNNFQVAWATKIQSKLIIEKDIKDVSEAFYDIFSHEKNINSKRVVLNQREIIEILNCEKSDFKKFTTNNTNMLYKPHRVGVVIKNGYLIYQKM